MDSDAGELTSRPDHFHLLSDLSFPFISFGVFNTTSNLQTSMSEELEDRKPTLKFDYEGFSTGEQNKVEDTSSSVKQRKLYNCVRLASHHGDLRSDTTLRSTWPNTPASTSAYRFTSHVRPVLEVRSIVISN